MTWIEWFCSLKGHECLCEVPYKYLCIVEDLCNIILADPSNYYGLNKMVSNYDDAYDVLVGNILGFLVVSLLIYREESYKKY